MKKRGAQLFSLLLITTGCSSEPGYTACYLDAASTNEAVATCGAAPGTVSCVVTDQIQCESRICARYQGSEPFCTSTCQTDSDCDQGECREFVLGTGAKYCTEE